MTNLEKYEAVNKSNSLEELAQVIESFADENGVIQGRTQGFPAGRMADHCRNFKQVQKNALTRKFGIRQQAMYLEYYGKY